MASKHDKSVRETRRWIRLAINMGRENKLLKEAGYFDENGMARKDDDGRRIRDSLQPQLSALPKVTEAEIDAELLRMAEALANAKSTTQ